MIAYLASPYSHPDPAVREERYRAACRAAAALLLAGQPVFSPIAHSHPLVEYGLPADWSFWQRYDRELLERCDEVVVLMLDGWEESVGVREEIRLARAMGKPVRYLAPELAPVSPTLAHVASGPPEADPTPNGADCPPTLAHVASEVPG
jgi:nucleoside 2-deoxyribosyltransferase